MPLVVGAASATAAGYSIDNSCRFNGTDGYLDLTFGTPTDNDKWSVSMWVKRSGTGIDNEFMMVAASNSTNYSELQFSSTEFWVLMNEYQGGAISKLVTNAYYRDMSAWYHMLFVYDSGNAAAGDRMKIYVNGTEITSFSTDNNPNLDQSSMLNSAVSHTLGSNAAEGGSRYFNGYIAEVVVCDGQAYAASDFGEFNEDSPTVWQPIDPSGLTFGDNGCYLDFKDSAALGNDVSGNNNDWTVNNMDAADQATDTPTNNFSTANSLNNYYSAATFTEGNLHMVMSSSAYAWPTGTVGLSAGKWYWETKVITAAYTNYMLIGASPFVSIISSRELGGLDDTCFGYYGFNGNIRKNQVNTAYGDSYTTNDVIGTYLDVDNSKIYFAKNGTIQNSGTGYDITAAASTTTGYWLPAWSQYFTGATFAANFGNPTYTLTSAVADPNGYGQFEYSPNDGGSASFDGSAKDFLAICTKNLGSDGG